MYKNVMWATDGSEAADRALAHAKALAAEGGHSVTVVYCEEFTLPGKGGGSLPVHANEDEVQEKIQRQVAELSSNGTKATLHTTRSKVGGAAHAIAEIADAGTRGRDRRGNARTYGADAACSLAGSRSVCCTSLRARCSRFPRSTARTVDRPVADRGALRCCTSDTRPRSSTTRVCFRPTTRTRRNGSARSTRRWPRWAGSAATCAMRRPQPSGSSSWCTPPRTSRRSGTCAPPEAVRSTPTRSSARPLTGPRCTPPAAPANWCGR